MFSGAMQWTTLGLESKKEYPGEEKTSVEPSIVSWSDLCFSNVSRGCRKNKESPSFPFTGMDSLSGRAKRTDRVPRAFPIIVPAYSKWFDSETIHPIEKRCVPKLLNKASNRNEKFYRATRDYIISLYRLNPRKYLSVADCREAMTGSPAAICTIHNFLEEWGLINYHVNLDTQPFATSTTNLASGSYPVMSHEPLKPLYPDDQDKDTDKDKENTARGSVLESLVRYDKGPNSLLEARRNVVQGAVGTFNEKKLPEAFNKTRNNEQVLCVSCGANCVNLRYQCRQRLHYTVCPACFADGNYDELLQSRDFKEISNNVEEQGITTWSENETLRLLEALQEHGDDWEKVAADVGDNKTRDQCVLHFLQLPIEEPILEHGYNYLGAEKQTLGARAPPTHPSRITKHDSSELPFIESKNPVMAQVAFLAQTVSPTVAAAAAQAALNTISKQIFVDDKEAPEGNVRIQTSFGKGYCACDKDGLPLARMDGVYEVQLDWGGQGFLNKTSIKSLKPNESTLSKKDMEIAASNCLAAAATKARGLALEEERICLRLVAQLVNTQMNKIEVKMKQVDQLQQWLKDSKHEIDSSYQKTFADKLLLAQRLHSVSQSEQ